MHRLMYVIKQSLNLSLMFLSKLSVSVLELIGQLNQDSCSLIVFKLMIWAISMLKAWLLIEISINSHFIVRIMSKETSTIWNMKTQELDVLTYWLNIERILFSSSQNEVVGENWLIRCLSLLSILVINKSVDFHIFSFNSESLSNPIPFTQNKVEVSFTVEFVGRIAEVISKEFLLNLKL